MNWLRVGAFAGLAALVALLLPITAHGDLFISNFNSALIFTDHPNFYHAVADEPTAVFPTGLSGGPYGPLFYYPTAAWLQLLDWLRVIDVDAWRGSSDAALSQPGTLLALKLPNLAVYVLVAVVIAKTVRGEHGRFAAWLWLANPAVILFTLMMGQNDGWTALASVGALYFALRATEGRALQIAGGTIPAAPVAMLCLAAGGAIKLSPLLLVPSFAWLLAARLRDRMMLAAISGAAFLLMIAPFLGTEYFWEHGLFGSQEGKATAFPTWSVVLLYVGFLTLVWTAERTSADRRWGLIFCFAAFHAFFFLIGGWSPQRAVLFIAALALTVPLRPWLIVPYVLTTAYSLLLALEHGTDIATALFAPLTTRALLIPALLDTKPEPLHALLLSFTSLAWLLGLALLWLRRTPSPYPRRFALLPAVLAVSLVIYLGLPSMFLQRGVDATPYAQPAAAQEIAAGDQFSFAFISPQDDLRSISLWLESGAGQAAIDVTHGEGNALYLQTQARLRSGRNEIDVPRVEDAKGLWFVVRITPERPVRVQMADVPSSLALAAAELNDTPLAGTALFTVHYETTWSTLTSDVASQLVDHWPAMLASFLCCALAFAWIGFLTR